MSSAEPSPGGVAAALARAATAQAETPFLFYRNASGHFRWCSYALAAAAVDQGRVGGQGLSVQSTLVEREAGELLGQYLALALAEGSASSGAGDFPGPEAAAGRDIWISWRPLSDPRELSLARWAIVSGAAILIEPGPLLHPELFAWARPTLISGSVDDLVGLASQLEALAPRFLRQRWFRQRAERLRLLLVEGEPEPRELEQVRARWREVSTSFSPRVAPFPRGSLV